MRAFEVAKRPSLAPDAPNRGREAPEHIRPGGLGERRKLPPWGPGRSSAAIDFGAYMKSNIKS